MQTIDDNIKNLNSETYLKNPLKEYSKIINLPLLTEKEEKELGYKLLNHDEEAKRIFIERNLKLVLKIAKKFDGVSDLSLFDLIQEGNLALIDAASKFDIRKGYRFSTYASNIISKKIFNATYNLGRNIRLNNEVISKLLLYIRARDALQNRLYRNPTYEEIADEMNEPVKSISFYSQILENTISLNSKIDEEDDELIDLLPSYSLSMEEEYLKRTIVKDVFSLINNNSKLNEREKTILIYRWGIGRVKIKTLKELGNEFGIVIERVRQIERRALIKSFYMKDINKYAVYMDNPDEAIKRLCSKKI